MRASAAPGDLEALGLAAAVDHRSLLGMLKAVHFRAAGGAGGGDGDGTRFQSRLGREVFMLTCKARYQLKGPRFKQVWSRLRREKFVLTCKAR